MIRKYHNQKLQTNPWHSEEETDNNHETSGRQTKRQSNQLPLPRSRIIMWLDWFRHPSIDRPLTFSFGPIKLKFNRDPLIKEELSFQIDLVTRTLEMAATPIYGKTPIKTRKPMTTRLGMQRYGSRVY